MKRKILKITSYIAASLILLLTAFHFWFIHHAEELLEELVASRSNGKLKLHVKHFRFNWFSNHMQLRQAVFYSTDTATAPTAYSFNVERITISVKEILPLVMEKKIVIDSLKLLGPDIRVTRLRALKDTDSTSKGLSLPQEMGRVYKSIQDGLRVLSVSKFHIDNGKFTLVNKIRTDELPVTITNIQLHLDNLKVDTSQSESQQKILFSDNVALQTHQQNILFPDGRHRLSFSHFGINIGKKLVEFDSCTIAATKEDSTQASFRIFFDKLRLTNIDFDTLYLKEVIKADSVYCINPQFRLDVQLEKKSNSPKSPPKLNELIQQLTGDLRIGFVIVKNGSFDINTIRDGKPSSFTSNNNNFEMQGLRIDQKSAHPLTVKSMAMAIRNYENFLRDSSYALQFDSILLVNNSINLSNFSVKQMRNGKAVNSFSIPNFQLGNFSWDDMVFEQQLAAGHATLYRPVINYSFENNRKQNIFKTLSGIGDIIQLNNLYVTDGRINLLFANGTKLELEGANVFLAGRDLVQSKQISSLQKSVRRLRFKNGTLRSGDLLIKMQNADITGTSGHLTAEKMIITNKDHLLVDAQYVTVGSMITDRNSAITEMNNIEWKQATIRLERVSGKNVFPATIIHNIRGQNTRLTTIAGDKQLSAFFETLSAEEFSQQTDQTFQIKGLATTGKTLSFSQQGMEITMDRFNLADHRLSSVQQLSVKQSSPTDSLSAIIPSLEFIPDINAIINGRIKAGQVAMSHPHISIRRQAGTDTKPAKKLPDVSIDKITIHQPDFLLDQPGSSGFTRVEWHSKEEKKNSLELSNLTISEKSGIAADKLVFSLADFTMEANGKKFNAGNGELKTEINNFYIRKSEPGEWSWHAGIKDLRALNFLFDNLGKNSGKLEIASVSLSNLSIASSTILNLRHLLMANKNFVVKDISGKYENEKNHFSWENAFYSKAAKIFSIESFRFHPMLSKDEFMAKQQYQNDYSTIRSKKITVDGFDIDRYLGDTILRAIKITVEGAMMENYRDKHLPFRYGIIKQLPTAALRKIPIKLDVDELNIRDAHIAYTELNHKTNAAGTVKFHRVNATILAVANYRSSATDSLNISAKAGLLDSMDMDLSFKQSHTDTAGGFLMKIMIGPGNARQLNPLTEPLGSVRIESGMIDSLHMRMTGNDSVANANMKLIYRDLKIKLLNNQVNAKKKNGTKKLASFFANAFAIRNNNRSRTVVFTYDRVRERSVFHYLWKTALRGIARSIGLKKG